MKNVKIFIVAISLALMATTCPLDVSMKVVVSNQSDEPITVITVTHTIVRLDDNEPVVFSLKPGESYYQVSEFESVNTEYEIFEVIVFHQGEFDGQSLSELIESGRWAMRKQYTYAELNALKFRIVYP